MAESEQDVIVIGAGPAGLMAAAQAASRHKTLLLDKNKKCARKLMITGKGRCNVTNASDLYELINHTTTNGKFLFGAFSGFTSNDTIEFFENLGVPIKIERGKRAFPESDKASDIVDALVNNAKRSGVSIRNAVVTDILIKEDKIEGVICQDGIKIFCKAVIICCGGKSYPSTGSTGDGYKFARKLGHTVTELKPSLIPLETIESYCADLQGLSLRNIQIEVVDAERSKVIYKDFGEMIFTHFGVSGPVILSASAFMRDMSKGKYTINIDLKPALDFEKLNERILRDFAKNNNKDFKNSLDELLPKSMIPTIIILSGIPENIKVNQITSEMRANLIKTIKCFPLTIKGFRPMEEAIVTSGGVSVKEINPKTMESKIVSGLFFAGETLDVDALTGGYNLQIAFSTGFLAGKSVLV